MVVIGLMEKEIPVIISIPYMNTLEKAKLTTFARHIERFSKLGILIYNPEVLGTACKNEKKKEKKKYTGNGKA